MTTIIDKIRPELLEAMKHGWCFSCYDANLDGGESGFVAIAHDTPLIFENAIQGTGLSPEEALDNLLQNIKTDADDDSDLEIE
jgi:hypothetical protein